MYKLLLFTLLFSQASFAQAIAAQTPTQSATAQTNEPAEILLPAIELDVIPPPQRASDNRTTVTRKDLELRQTQTLADALRHVEGVSIVNSGGPGKPSSVFIRGSNADHVLVLIDGVEMNDLLSPSRGASLDQVFADEVESIEVLRGPQTLRYGASALNGVINIKTKKGAGAPKRLVKAELGKYKSVDGMLGLAGGEPDSNYDIRYSQFQTDGFSTANSKNGNQESDGVSQSQVSGRFGASPLKNLDLDLSARYVDTHNEIDGGGAVFSDDPDYYTHTRKLLTSLQTHSVFDHNFIELNNLVSLQRFERISKNSADIVSPAATVENYHGQLLKVASAVNLNWTQRYSTEVGADFKEDRGRSANQFSDQKSSMAGVFISNSHNSPNGIFLDFGTRFDHHSSTEENYITYQAGIGHWLGRSTTLRLGGGTSIKQPSLYQLYSSFGNPNLKTEEGTAADLKVEHSFFNGFGKLSSSIFYNHFENLIDVRTLNYENVGEAQNYGYELVARSPVAAGILLGGTYTRLNSKNLSTGSALLRRPKDSANADLQLNLTPTLQFLYSANFVGQREDINRFNATTMMGSHVVARLVMNYQLSKDSQIYTRIENLHDKKYEEVSDYGTSRRAAYVGFKSQF